MGWKPSYPGEVPTLGYSALEWITENLAAPDHTDYQPLVFTREQAEFVIEFYRIDPRTGKRVVRRGVIVRSKGWGKSPFLSAIAIHEALGPAIFDGWDADGRPVGRPWATIRTPLVQIAAVSDDQTKNAWDPLLEMVREGPVMDNYPGLDPLDSFVALPRKGRIMPVTASFRSREGNRPVFVVMDQTESWIPSNSGVKLASTLRRNLAKTGGSSIEAPNAWIPGERSVAEMSAKYAGALAEGKKLPPGLLFDSRSAPADVNVGSKRDRIRALAIAYGDSAELPRCRIHNPPCRPADGWPRGWVDLNRMDAEILDPDNSIEDSRRFYFNQIWAAESSWLAAPEVEAVTRTEDPIVDGDVITVGFDGSRKRGKGITDATALIGCRVRDGRLFSIRVWEQPEGPFGQNWTVPVHEVNSIVAETFAKYRVVGMFADPAKWDEWVAKWEALYGSKLKVKATRDRPMTWWMTGGRSSLIVRATEQLHDAIVDGEATHDGSATLMRHLLNARMRQTRSGIQIMKESPDSPNKIDAAIAAILAWQARLAAISAGVTTTTARRPRRIR